MPGMPTVFITFNVAEFGENIGLASPYLLLATKPDDNGTAVVYVSKSVLFATFETATKLLESVFFFLETELGKHVSNVWHFVRRA